MAWAEWENPWTRWADLARRLPVETVQSIEEDVQAPQGTEAWAAEAAHLAALELA